MMEKHNIGVLGGGSWATALVKLISGNNVNVNWWIRNRETVEYIKKYNHNPRYLSAVEIRTDRVFPSSQIKEVVEQSDWIILAIPAAFIKQALSALTPEDLRDKYIFSAVKGIIPETNEIPADYLHHTFGVPFEKIGIITGPCHAEEVALEKLSYLTIASSEAYSSKIMADWLACRYLKTIISTDIIGTEYAAVLKNIYALASGICNGLGYGDNFQAVLISAAIREMNEFVSCVCEFSNNINDSAYTGDLLVTAYSQFSRNRTFGNMIGRGYSVKSAQIEMNMIAEGYYAVKCIHEINKKYQASTPIIDAVYNILYERISPVIEIKLLSDKLQ
jgi:glycerol-3-phosphate dehydrogenase (NAD(P)+)